MFTPPLCHMSDYCSLGFMIKYNGLHGRVVKTRAVYCQYEFDMIRYNIFISNIRYIESIQHIVLCCRNTYKMKREGDFFFDNSFPNNNPVDQLYS
jgi:hypothetical protein